MNNEELTYIFQNVGKSFGFSNVKARFITTDNIEIKGTSEGSSRIVWTVSDYLSDAPISVMRDLAFTYYDIRVGRPDRFTQATIDYLLSDGFIETSRAKYLSRYHARPMGYYAGIPIYTASIHPGSTLFSSPFRVILIPEDDPVSKHKTRFGTIAEIIKDYPRNLQSKVYDCNGHADCRHCTSEHRYDCRYKHDMNNPPYIELCPHWVIEGSAI